MSVHGNDHGHGNELEFTLPLFMTRTVYCENFQKISVIYSHPLKINQQTQLKFAWNFARLRNGVKFWYNLGWDSWDSSGLPNPSHLELDQVQDLLLRKFFNFS